MSQYDDTADPLELAFALPIACKMLKPGETLPGLDSTSQRNDTFEDVYIEPDAALSSALDDAFSDPNFGSKASIAPQSVPVQDAAAIDAKLARDLDDAFANPKAGNKIEDGTGLSDAGLHSSGLQSIGLDMPRTDDLQFGQASAKSGGLSGPKMLVIALVLGFVAVAAAMGGNTPTSSEPTILRVD